MMHDPTPGEDPFDEDEDDNWTDEEEGGKVVLYVWVSVYFWDNMNDSLPKEYTTSLGIKHINKFFGSFLWEAFVKRSAA